MAPLKRKNDAVGLRSRPEKKPKVSAGEASFPLKEDAPFPRGGASVLTPLEHKQIKIQAKQDVLFEQNTGTKPPKNSFEDENESEPPTTESPSLAKSKPEKGKGAHKRKKSSTSVTQEQPLRIESLSYKRLVPGSIVLGQVSRINRDDIALSLPNNLTGFVPLTSISDQITKRLQDSAEEDEQSDDAEEDKANSQLDLSKIFTLGQYLRAAVVSTEEEIPARSKKIKRHIELSLKPQQANAGLKAVDLIVNGMIQAAVRSKEDHGVIMDLGIEGGEVQGFINAREFGSEIDLSTIEEGSVHLCMVTAKSSNDRIIKLTLDQQKISNIKHGSFVTDAPSVSSFLPGTAVEILVSGVTPTGLYGKVMGLLDVTADTIHSGSASSNKDRAEKYPIGSKAKGRVLCTFPTSEQMKLGVSLQDHILYWRSKTVNETAGAGTISPVAVLPVSTIVDKATVAKVDPSSGLFLDIGLKGVRGFAHISKLSDSRIDTVLESTGNYKVGSVHKARVTGYNSIDGLFILSLEPAVINQPFLFLEDVKAGQRVKGTVQKFLISPEGVSGAIFDLANGISGLVPDMHLADVRLQHPERKFKEGMTVSARVLSVDPQKRQIRLTMKRSLVNSDGEPWTDYAKLKPGMQGPGTIIKILSNGAVVQFYASLRAFLPVSEMSESFIQDPREHFQTGQIVNIQITSISPDEKRMTVSCRDHTISSITEHEAVSALTVGEQCSGTVSEKTRDEIIVELEGSRLKAKLPFEHLVDGSAKKAESMAKRIRVDQVLKDAIILNKNEVKGSVQLTSKPSLVTAAAEGKLLKSIDDVIEGNDVHGFVNNITSAGIFVRFAGELTGLLLKHQLEDNAAKLPEYGFRRGESISARVLTVDYGEAKFLLTRKLVEHSDKTLSAKGAPKVNENILNDANLINPADETSTSIEDYSIGKVTKAKILSVKETQINVQLAERVQGRINVSEIFDTMEDVSDRKQPLKKFHAKMVIPVRILGMHDPRNHRFLPISHRQGGPSVFELSAKPSTINAEKLDILTIAKVKAGSSWLATVNNIAEDCVWVNLSPNVRGRIRAMDVSDDISLLRDLAYNFPVGSMLKVKVLKAEGETNHLDLTARSSGSSKPLNLQDLSPDMVLPGRVTKVTDRQIMVQLGESISGAVHLVDMADDYSKADLKAYHKNQTVRVSVKKVDRPNKRIALSTRPSRILSSSLSVQDKDITSFSQLNVNDTIRGFIKNVADSGIFISLATDIISFVRVSDLSDLFLKDWKAGFEVDQVVEGKIIALDPLLNHVQMSLKRSHLDQDYKPPLTFTDMEVGQVVTGKVRKVEDFGAFVVVDNSANVSGLCHKSKMSDSGADPRKLYEEGDAVQAKILNINTQKRQISFGLDPSFFDDVKDRKHPVEGVVEDDNGASEEDANSIMISDEGGVELEGIDLGENSDGDDKISDSDVDRAHSPPNEGFNGLSTSKFDWTGGIETFGNDVDDDALFDTGASTAVLSTSQRKKRKANIQIDQTGNLDTHGPQSAADFERLLLSQPHSSILWVRYMAFQLELSEIDAARAIGDRALASIPMNEETDKLQIWIALLNLESAYGTADTLASVFERACTHHDPFTLHTHLTSIHIRSSHLDEADQLFQTTLTKFPASPALYENYATFLFTHTPPSSSSSPTQAKTRARALLQRGMQTLPQRDHLPLTVKFAQLEFKHGDPERARTMFESVMERWPKRWDLWSVWLDMEMRPGTRTREGAGGDADDEKAKEDRIRRLFERITMTGGGSDGKERLLKPKKAKIFFKRWLEWEGSLEGKGSGSGTGNGKGRERVEALAREWVSRHGGKGKGS